MLPQEITRTEDDPNMGFRFLSVAQISEESEEMDPSMVEKGTTAVPDASLNEKNGSEGKKSDEKGY